MKKLKREYQGNRDLVIFRDGEDYRARTAISNTPHLADDYFLIQTSEDSEILGSFFNANVAAVTAINDLFMDNAGMGVASISKSDIERILCESK